jgi:hypothetical protein
VEPLESDPTLIMTLLARANEKLDEIPFILRNDEAKEDDETDA